MEKRNSFKICTLHLILLRYIIYGLNKDMWHTLGKQELYTQLWSENIQKKMFMDKQAQKDNIKNISQENVV